MHGALVVSLAWAMNSCASQQGGEPSQLQLKDPRTADPFDVVDCLLPGQIRQLGTRVTYVTERRPIRTTAEDCAIRGGEYVALDRADYATALQIWLGAAEGGDPDAQYYVGVLYEKGAEGQPNYHKAASWYRQAASAWYWPKLAVFGMISSSPGAVAPELTIKFMLPCLCWLSMATISTGIPRAVP